MRKYWIPAGRVLWVFLALISIVTFVLTQAVAMQLLQNPSERISAGLAELGISLTAYAALLFISVTVLFLTYFIVALLIFLRRPGDGFALFVSIFLLSFGSTNAYPQFAEFMQFYQNPPAWYAIPSLILTLSSYPFFAVFFAVYPDGKFVPRWVWFVAACGFFLSVAWGFFPNQFTGSPTPLAIVGGVSVAILITATLYAQIWRYRHHSTPLQRQQTKWFLFGVAITLVLTIWQIFFPLLQQVATLTPAASVRGDLALTTSILGYAVVPIAIGIAILRYRLWDIDVIIRRTVTYGLVTFTSVIVFFASVVLLQQLFARVTSSGQNELATVLSTLAIAALFVPLRNKIQELIDRRFYRQKYDAQKVLTDFATTVRDETDLEKLTARLMQVVHETMQPKSVSLWLKQEKEQKGGRP